MTTSTRRRNRVDRADAWIVVALAAVAGITGVASGAEPTGSTAPDVVLVFALAAFVTWAGASSPWWALAVAAGLAALFAGTVVLTAVALVALGVALWIGATQRSLAWQRAASAAITVQVLLRLQADVPFGVTALVAGVAALLIAVAGVVRRRKVVRRRVLVGAGVVLLCTVAASAGMAALGLTARADLQDGVQGLRDGLDQLDGGDTAAASDTLRLGAERLAAAADTLDAVVGKPAEAVPVVAQHRTALVTLAAAAATTATSAADALDQVDLDQLRVEDGQIDLTAVEALREPLARLEEQVGALDGALGDAGSPWLVAPVQDRLADASDDVSDASRQVANARAAAAVGPALLGADGPRRYFLAFTSQAEQRAQSGMMGNWAEVTVDAGHFEQTGSGRTAALGDAADGARATLEDLPREFFDRYGRFGAGSPGQPVAGKYWSNITMPAHGPYVGQTMAQLYGQGLDRPVDGVLIFDVVALADLLRVTGPIEVPGVPMALDAGNLAEYLYRGQYDLAESDRESVLDGITQTVVQALLQGELPPPQDLVDALGDAAVEGHLTAWAADPDEQALFAQLGMDGALPDLDGRDGLAVTGTNAGGNKIDTFLHRDVGYEATADQATGEVTATVTVTLRNDAPSSGLPDYVIGNLIDEPTGTNRVLVSIYSPLAAVEGRLDDTIVPIVSESERGWGVSTIGVDLPAGTTATIELDLAGTVAPGPYQLVVRPQPTANPDEYDIEVRDPGGGTLVEYQGEIDRRTVLSSTGRTDLPR